MHAVAGVKHDDDDGDEKPDGDEQEASVFLMATPRVYRSNDKRLSINACLNARLIP